MRGAIEAKQLRVSVPSTAGLIHILASTPAVGFASFKMSDTISIPLEYPVGRLELIDLPVRVAGSKTAAVLLGGSAGLA